MLSKIKLQCMELWADITLSFWCCIIHKSHSRKHIKKLAYYWVDASWDWQRKVSDSWNIKESECITIWHPITRWRLCYLQSTYNSTDTSTRYRLKDYFELQNSLYDKSILERPEEFCQNILLPFLQSING